MVTRREEVISMYTPCDSPPTRCLRPKRTVKIESLVLVLVLVEGQSLLISWKVALSSFVTLHLLLSLLPADNYYLNPNQSLDVATGSMCQEDETQTTQQKRLYLLLCPIAAASSTNSKRSLSTLQVNEDEVKILRQTNRIKRVMFRFLLNISKHRHPLNYCLLTMKKMMMTMKKNKTLMRMMMNL